MHNKQTLLITAPYFPPHSGGLERYVYEVSNGLRATNEWRVVILTTAEKGNDDSVEEINGYTVYRLRYSRTLSNTPFSWSWFSKIRNIIRSVRPDIVNIHTPVPGIGDIASLYANHVPVVVTYHANSMRKGRLFIDILVWMYEHGPLRYMLNKASHIICSSEAVRVGFLSAYTHKSTTISPGVDCATFMPNKEKRSERPTILFVAALGKAEQYKGLQTILDILPAIIVSVPNVRLLVVGEGDMVPAYVQHVHAHGLEHTVEFAGKLSGFALVEAYQASTILVLPTTNDSSPMVLTEAMACGLPVISSPIAGIPMIIQDGVTGLLIDPKDTKNLTDSVVGILKNHEYAGRLGVEARRRVEKQFSWTERITMYSKIMRTHSTQHPTVVEVTAYFPPHLGGIEKVAETTTHRLAKAGRQVIVITSNPNALGTEERAVNITIRRITSVVVAHIPFAPTLLLRLFQIPKHSIIHFHLAPAYWPEVTLLVASLRRIPYVVHFHLDIGPSSAWGIIFTLYKKIVWGPFLRHATSVIVCSEEQVGIVTQKYRVSAQRVTVIPNAVGDEFFTASPRHQAGTVLKLLYVGRLAAQKRVERLIDTMALLQIPAMLTLVGDGNCRAELEQRVAQKKLTNITFAGYKDSDAIRTYYASHDVLLISSDSEGLPLVVLEAMAAGLPVIGTDVIGIRELVHDAGILVQEPYIEHFVRSITHLWESPNTRTTLSEQGTRKARHYTWDAYDKKLNSVFDSVTI